MPIKRETADAYLRALPARIEEINTRGYAYRVVQVEVFGSYLSDKPLLGDLDLLVTLQMCGSGIDEQEKLRQQRRRMAKAAGRTFRSGLDEVFWPQCEVWRALRGKRYSVSLTPASHKSGLRGPFRLVWKDEQPMTVLHVGGTADVQK